MAAPHPAVYKSTPISLFPLGDAAVVLQFGDAIDPATQQAIRTVGAHLAAHPFPGLVETVPAYTTLTVYYNPWIVSGQGRRAPYPAVEAFLRELLALVEQEPAAAAPKVVEIPVCYGGALGPDLAEVARHCGLTPAEVISRHAGVEYLVHMIGFAPGFPYLGGLDPQLATPRKAQPRALVPAGSVGLAGRQTGIYSLPTPGGWQLIGRTPSRLFLPERHPASLLHAGDTVRFVPITEAEFNHLQAHEC